MNILLINHYAGSIYHGMEFRAYYVAKEWIKKGHNVRIITADYSHLRSNNPDIKKDFEITNIDGIEYQWIKTTKYESNGVKRAITMVQFCGKLYRNAKKITKDFKPDVVITSSTYPLDTYPAQRIAKKAKAKYIHEGHDIWPLTLTNLMGMSKLHPLVILLAMAEKSAYKNSEHVVSVLPYSWKHMLEHGLQNKDKFTHIPNGIVIEDWEKAEPVPKEHEALMTELKSQGKKIVCYLGGHARSNALDVLVDAATESKNSNVAYVLVGKGNEKQRLMEKAGEAANIHFLPPVNKKAVPTILSMADFLYIGAEKCELYKFGVSMNKVYDYMMASKPIIYGVEAANNDVADSNCGINIDPSDASSILKAVDTLLAMPPEELEAMGERGKKAVMEKYNYSSLADVFLDVMK